MVRFADRCKTENRQPEGSLPLPPIENGVVRTKKDRIARPVRVSLSRLQNLIPVFLQGRANYRRSSTTWQLAVTMHLT